MIRCEKCGNYISSVKVNRFMPDGSDKFFTADLVKTTTSSNAVYIDVDENWTGYECSDEEKPDTITCPYCNKFPFEDPDIQEFKILRLVMFTVDV